MNRTISIKDDQAWDDLKMACLKRKLTISAILERYIHTQLHNWKMEDQEEILRLELLKGNNEA